MALPNRPQTPTKSVPPDPVGEALVTVGTCAIAPVPCTLLTGMAVGFSPINALIVANVVVGAFNCNSNLKWMQKKGAQTTHATALKTGKRAASMQIASAVISVPSLMYDSYRTGKYIQENGNSILPTASLTFTLAAAAGLTLNAIRAERVRTKIGQELAGLNRR